MPYVTTGQVARELGVSVRAIQKWVAQGLMEPDYRTPGGHMRWDLERLHKELRNPTRYRRHDG